MQRRAGGRGGGGENRAGHGGMQRVPIAPPCTRLPPGPQLRAPTAPERTPPALTPFLVPAPPPIWRMSDRPAAGGLDVWARERETGWQLGVWLSSWLAVSVF